MFGRVTKLLKVFTLLLLVLSCQLLQAQFDEHSFKKIIIEIDGEEVYDVNAITQDHQGYIWMATNLGLIRYDGLEGKKYFSDPSSNDYNGISALHVDSQGDIWIGAVSGLIKYNSGCDCISQFPAIDYNTSLTGITSITEDHENNLWIGTWNSGLFRYDLKEKSFTRFLNKTTDPIRLVNDRIVELLVDRNNNLWIATDSDNSIKNSGLVRYNLGNGEVKQFLHDTADMNSLIDDRISALYEDHEGKILIGTYNSGFHIFDPDSETLSRINYDSSNPTQLHATHSAEIVQGNDPYVKLIHQDKNGAYWIQTSGKGVNYFDLKTNTFKNYHFDLVNPQLLWSIFEDRQSNLWIGGVHGSGLFKTDLRSRKYSINTYFTNVEGSYESPLNPKTLWVRSQEKGLSKLNMTTNEIVNFVHDENDNNSIGHNWVRSVYQEKEGVLWLGLGNGGADGFGAGNGGIDRLDIESGTFTHFKLTRNDDSREDFSYTVYSIAQDQEGRLWLGTGEGGIFMSNKEKTKFEHLDLSKNEDISPNSIINLVRIDSNGSIWASDFEGDGTLYLYDIEADKFKPYLKGFKAYRILIDGNGWLFISTWKKGVLHLNPQDGSYTRYTKKDGLPSDSAIDILLDDNGVLWINTRIGPAKFDTESGNIASIGLPKSRYNTGIIKASDNRIYLGAHNGLMSFHPEEVIGNRYPPQTAISNLMIFKEEYSTEDQSMNDLILPHDKNDLAFRYVGLHFSDPAKNSYKVRLQPIYDDWLEVGSEQTARYFNLSPGNYYFEVKSSNSYGVWSEDAAVAAFTIKPPWWITWWAYVLYFLLFGFLANRIYRFQLSKKLAASESQRLREVNEFKNNLFTNITHEFRTPITVIKGMTDSVRSKLNGKKIDDVDDSLEMIRRNSDELLHLVNEMLDLAKIESGNMKLQFVQTDVIPLIKYVCESFDSYAEENNLSLTIYSEIDSLTMDFDVNKLTSVFSNLLSNAVKFTSEGGKIIVHINRITKNEKPYLFFKIKDSGIGIAQEDLSNIFSRFYQTDATTVRQSEGTGIGLALTKEIIDLMQGTIEVKSTLGKGSEFSVSIPITNNAPKSDTVEMGKASLPSGNRTALMQTEETGETDTDHPLVLIIEDNNDVAHYLQTCLKNDFETIHASDGILGIEIALERIPDIIISDVMMPGKDGFEVCATLKSDERTDHIPIIILTAKATFEDKLKGLSHGADAYLAKPFHKDELITRLDQLVSIRRKLVEKIQKEGFNVLLSKRSRDPKLQFLKKIAELVHKDIGSSTFGSKDLAKALLISESQLYRKLKAITGKSTAVYIRSIRLQCAKDLLVNTNKSVSEVAFEVGFNDPSWFSRAFKDEFGFSPSATSI